ncbi:restriction endonuclease [Sphingomonas sp. AOB5]|uniref:nSTAND3 domain-containing NTPase n=1 Tax=Sphingomonas sp. AOB5 TaxID=3034017 RepID=UPI0023F728FE|nr:restriction endonuclease [Sphingomonas sp. AOB5]MDF7773766.1 restriction endonuclease [Sphingomonas sp. AOB5]
MAEYNLGKLSHADFEELVHDLLEAEWESPLESFKTGRDGGVDLRRIDAGASTIIQCKHFEGSSFSTLLSKLKSQEIAKVRALAPARYILVTSVGLTPGNKDAIVEAMYPFILTPEDVIGASEIEDLLRNHDEVVKRHYKLWLTSTAVMERVLHAAEHARTEIHIAKIIRKLPVFVRNDAFPRALQALEDHRQVILSGPPGIGKSTLADILLYAHLEDGFLPAIITGDLAEGHVLARAGKRMLFYYDDFLGETYLGDRPEYLGRKEDKALVDFIEYVQQSEGSRFILTSREHILADALQRSERLRQSGFADHRCVIELSDYSKSQRARILYNHLYFSGLPEAYKEAMLADDFFLEVIEHEHFNPRVIEWLSTLRRLRSVPAEAYQDYVTRLLDNPEEIWRHAFEQEISGAARGVLILVYSLGYFVGLDDLRSAWDVYEPHCAAKYNYSSAPNSYRDALKELDGSFLRYDEGRVLFLNPSVRDFMATVLERSPDTVSDLLSTAIRFRQVADIADTASLPESAPELKAFVQDNMPLMLSAYSRLITTEHVKWVREKGNRVGHHVDFSPSQKVRHLVEVSDDLQANGALDVVRQSLDHLLSSNDVTSLVYAIQGFRESPWLNQGVTRYLIDPAVDHLLEVLPFAMSDDCLTLLDAMQRGLSFEAPVRKHIDDVIDQIVHDGFSEERDNCDGADDLTGLRDTLTRMQERHAKNLKYEIASIDEALAELEDDNEDFGSGDGLAVSNQEEPARAYGDDDIRDLFGTLFD